jgi:hypothetical protein
MQNHRSLAKPKMSTEQNAPPETTALTTEKEAKDATNPSEPGRAFGVAVIATQTVLLVLFGLVCKSEWKPVCASADQSDICRDGPL